MATWLRWQEDVEQWRRAMEQRQDEFDSRMESVEELARLVPEILERLGPQTLTTEHQHTVQSLVKRLHELAGYSYGLIYADLNQAFHVGKYADIPDDQWPRVAAWFKARIEAAERR